MVVIKSILVLETKILYSDDYFSSKFLLGEGDGIDFMQTTLRIGFMGVA
jgi:hypothetical protein